jgi:hypothetical protein
VEKQQNPALARCSKRFRLERRANANGMDAPSTGI